MCAWRHMPFPTCRGIRETQKNIEERLCEGTVAILKRSLFIWVVYLKILIRENLFNVNLECWDRSTVKFCKGTWHVIQIRERKGPPRGIIQNCAPHERSPCAPKFGERSREETLHWERCARKAAWDLAKKIFTSSRIRTEQRSIYTPIEAIVMPVTSTRPEERKFVVESGASMHMISKKELSSGEMDTVKGTEPLQCVDCKRGSAHPRGGTSVRSWFKICS